MSLDLVELRRQSKIAAILTALSSLLVLASLLFGYVQTNRAQRKVMELSGEADKLTIQIKSRKKEADLLQHKVEALNQQINGYISNKPVEAAQTETVLVAGHEATISVNIAETRDRTEAEKAAEVLRSDGYRVTGIDVKRLGEATHETTVRFFQYDRQTVAVGKRIVDILKGAGFTVRPEFDDEFVGQSTAPPPGTYEFWIGMNPSYHASLSTH
jgi:uncharacterized protein YoxC